MTTFQDTSHHPQPHILPRHGRTSDDASGTRAGVIVPCGHAGSTPAAPTQPSPAPAASALSTTASAYLTSIIDIAQRSSINRLTIDWTAYRTSVFDAAGSAQSIAELNPAIRTAITLLRDGHSSYRSASGTTIFVAAAIVRAAGAGAAVVAAQHRLGAVGAFSGTPEQANAYAPQIQDAIAAADRDDLARLDCRSQVERRRQHVADDRGPRPDSRRRRRSDTSSARPARKPLWEYRDGVVEIGRHRRHDGAGAVTSSNASGRVSRCCRTSALPAPAKPR